MSATQTITQLQTRKNDAGSTRLKPGALMPGDGCVLLKLSSFALTANNITYAAFGDAMNYWRFFPTGDDEWGHMPVWGFAEITRSGSKALPLASVSTGIFRSPATSA